MNLVSRKRPAGEAVGGTRCNICDSDLWKPDPWKRLVKCAGCGSRPRHRICLLVIDHMVLPAPGARVLHFAPEAGLSRAIEARVGAETYEPVDFSPERLEAILGRPVGRFDLCKDSFELPSGRYDLILHNHVLEHLPCNYTMVLQALTRALAPGGVQVFTVPMTAGHYREDLSPNLTPEQRNRAFKQGDHLRIFGKTDFADTLGRVVGATRDYAIVDFLPKAALAAANIPSIYWRGVSGSSPFFLRPEGRAAASLSDRAAEA